MGDTYNLKDVVVLKNTDYFVHTDSYSNQLGKYASHIIVKEINAKLPVVNKRSREKKVTVSASGGNCTYSTLRHLSDELDNTGFMRHIYNLGLQSFLGNFDIAGEIACAPFGQKGFLFHYLVGEVFERKNGKFRYDECEQLERLKKIANKNIQVSKQDLIDAATFFSSIITVNFCEIEKSLHKEANRPYILLLVGGESQKALPLKILLERWKAINILDGIVTSENIAGGL